VSSRLENPQILVLNAVILKCNIATQIARGNIFVYTERRTIIISRIFSIEVQYDVGRFADLDRRAVSSGPVGKMKSDDVSSFLRVMPPYESHASEAEQCGVQALRAGWSLDGDER
jgi:hypothetical protein